MSIAGRGVVASSSVYRENTTLLIIAGGSSRRMGTDKLLLPVPPKEIPLVRHVAERLLPLVGNVIVIANDPGVSDAVKGLAQAAVQHGQDGMHSRTVVRCLQDDTPGDGPLGGLATGLRRIDGWALTVAGDMPFISAACCRFLIDNTGVGCDAVVPVLDGQSQPLHAVYSRRCLPSVEKAMAAGERRMDSFWHEVRVRLIAADQLRAFDPDLHTFTNVNTPSEWKEARALLSQG
ncbi:MAG: molybdenum cofactor guanylyltransferase [Caldilineaceae bacterium]|nr:molybdenum cofactor guanylyltransferase [Caldilineaceae bacterium]